MDQRTRAYVASAGVVGIFLLVQVGALALVAPFEAAGYQAVENPQNPTNTVVYVLAILAATGLLLAAMRFDLEVFIRLLLVGAGAYIALYVLRLLVPPVVVIDVGGIPVNVLAWGIALAFGVALWTYPEWYVIDAAGIVMGAGAAALFGISFGILSALLLLVVLAVYDAISVYGTEHMLTLASGVMDLKVPIVLVVPLSLSYSYRTAETPDPAAAGADTDGGDDAAGGDDNVAAGGAGADAGDDADRPGTAAAANGGEGTAVADPDGDAVTDDTSTDDAPTTSVDGATERGTEGEPAGKPDAFDREALFIGLGDAVIPAVLVASAAVFAPASVPSYELFGVRATLPALSAMAGTLVGLVVLLWMVLKGRAHAGLPLLNGGTIAGYLLGAVASGMTLAGAIGLEAYL